MHLFEIKKILFEKILWDDAGIYSTLISLSATRCDQEAFSSARRLCTFNSLYYRYLFERSLENKELFGDTDSGGEILSAAHAVECN